MNLRDYARNQPCKIRLDGICNGNVETTVLAHFRQIGTSGLGLKSPDLYAAWACSDCHDAVDRRRFIDLDREFVQLAHLQGVMRTQATLIEKGIVKW